MSEVRHERRGLALSFAFALLSAIGCLFSWANLDVLVFHRSYAGTHFGEGRLALAFALAALALAVAAFAEPRLVYALPLPAAATLGLVASKYHDVATASSSFHGFRLSTVTVGGGLMLALVASALLLGGSLLALFDHLGAARSRPDAPRPDAPALQED